MVARTLWSTPPDEITLGQTEVHVWRAALEVEATMVSRMYELLSADEWARAERFHFQIDRRHFIVARAHLRMILSRYINIEPAEVRFRYSEHGKPMLANGNEQGGMIKFNLAHSAGIALFAFTRAGEIGVDLERIRPEITGDDIARRFFSAAELACLERVPAPARQEAFFDCWTRKEAFVKAKEIGLSLALDQFDVTLGPKEPAALLRTGWDADEASRWSLKAIDVGPGYVGAVAVGALHWDLNCYLAD
jgi:4'-phosphopantetheinyl transferase